VTERTSSSQRNDTSPPTTHVAKSVNGPESVILARPACHIRPRSNQSLTVFPFHVSCHKPDIKVSLELHKKRPADRRDRQRKLALGAVQRNRSITSVRNRFDRSCRSHWAFLTERHRAQRRACSKQRWLLVPVQRIAASGALGRRNLPQKSS
jgi:hypothetical protein